MPTDPIALFADWYAEACEHEPTLPSSMALATADADGRPSARMVLLKSHGSDGFTFYTNDHSRKGVDLAANPRAALLFHWKSLSRQVRVEGPVERLPAAEADAYFATRERDSQIGAWASDQSAPLEARDGFEAHFAELKAQYDGREVPRPPHWNGYRVIPQAIEFWSERPHRLHERRLFTRSGDGWSEGLLYP